MRTAEEVEARVALIEGAVATMSDEDCERSELEAMVVALRWVVEKPTDATVRSPGNIWR